jgi:guanylate kinase
MGEDLVSIFILPPSMAELDRRLHSRGTDSDDVIVDRMRRAASEIGHWAEYDYVLINEDMDRCLEDVKAIVVAERLKRTRQPGLVAFVRELVERP